MLLAGGMLYALFIITAMVSFGVNENTMYARYFFECILIGNCIDIVLTCNMGFYKKGVLCKDRHGIWRKYVSE